MDAPTDARSAAFFRLFEYGAATDTVFPMPSAVDGYRRLWEGPHAWATGPFSVSVNRLDEYITSAGNDVGIWPVGISLDFPDPEWVAATRAGVATAQVFGIRTKAKIRHFDTRLPMGAGLRHGVNIAMTATGDTPVYFEVELLNERSVLTSLESLVAELDLAGPRLRAAAVVDPGTPGWAPLLASFIAEAQDARIRTRLRGGLTRPISTSEGPGIVNVLAAYAFGSDRAEVELILRETNPAAFSLDERAFQVDQRSAGRDELGHLRWTELNAIELSNPGAAIEGLTELGFILPD